MTPNITRMLRLMPSDMTGWHFIDVGALPARTERRQVDADLVTHPPYQQTVFVGQDRDGLTFALTTKAGDGSVTVAAIGTRDGTTMTRMWNPVAFIDTPQGLSGYAGSGAQLSRDEMAKALRWLHACFDAMPQTAYRPSASRSFVNTKRARKGKAPLYDWVTVDITPPKPKSLPQGGTHASPRQHDRRGHWRTVRDRRVWVRECKVGDPSRGARFKDYQVRGSQEVMR